MVTTLPWWLGEWGRWGKDGSYHVFDDYVAKQFLTFSRGGLDPTPKDTSPLIRRLRSSIHLRPPDHHVGASGAFGRSQKSSRAVYTFKIVYSTVIHTLHTILHRSGGIALLRRVQRHKIYTLVYVSNEMDRCRYDGACQQCGLLYLL